MNELTPFNFEGHQLRHVIDEHGEPWFHANDLCEALGYANPRQALDSHVAIEDVQKLDTPTPGGRQSISHVNESGLYALIFGSKLEAAARFKRWVTSEVLPSIRKTGGYQAKGGTMGVATDALKLTPLAVRAARAFGLDKNAAAISANQFVRKLTGMNLLEDFGHTHLEADNQKSIWFTPTELGIQMGGLSGKKVNLLLADAGLQVKVGEQWQPLDAGKGFARIFDTGKHHGSGVPVQQLKWAATVTPLLKIEETA